MEHAIKIIDELIRDCGEEHDRNAWDTIKSAMCEANAHSVLSEVRATIQEEIGINQANTELACGIRQGLLLAVYIIDRKIGEHFR